MVGPSYGWKSWADEVTITSPVGSFGSATDVVTVMLRPLEGGNDVEIKKITFKNSTVIKFKQPPSGTVNATSFVVYVKV